MPHETRHIGRLTELRIADNVQVRETCKAQRFADPVASGFLNIKQNLRRVGKP